MEIETIVNAVKRNENGNFECLIMENGSVVIRDYEDNIIAEYEDKQSADKDWFIF